MRISRLVCSTSTIPSSRHSVAISSGAVIGENNGGTRDGSSATAMSHIMRQCVNPPNVSQTAAVTVPPRRTTRRISATARDLIRTRTAEGRNRAKLQGKHMGRPPA